MHDPFLVRTSIPLFFLTCAHCACSPADNSGAVAAGDDNGSGGTATAPGESGSGGQPGGPGNDLNSDDTIGTGGGLASGGTVGTGGAGSGHDIGTGGDPEMGGTPGSGGAEGGSVEACPADAYFCTGFEEAGIPAGATYHPDYQASMWENFMTIQSAQVKAGAQALEVKGVEGYMWNVLSTPVPSSTFWTRFYLRSSVEIGQSEHNSYVAAMTGDGEPNIGDNTEISEQYCQMVLNLHDTVATSIGGTAMCETGVAPLPANTWHCVEVQFDGPAGVVRVWANNQPIIDVTDWEALDYKSFGFGYFGFHGPARTLWYDDVAVGPTRPGCPK